MTPFSIDAPVRARFPPTTMVDLAVLSSMIVKHLAPALPWLLKASEGAAEKIGGSAWELAKRIWESLRNPMESHPAAREAAEDVAADDTEDARAAFRHQVRKLLEQRPTVAQELQQLFLTETRTVAASEGAVAIGGAAEKNIIITGNNASVKSQK